MLLSFRRLPTHPPLPARFADSVLTNRRLPILLAISAPETENLLPLSLAFGLGVAATLLTSLAFFRQRLKLAEVRQLNRAASLQAEAERDVGELRRQAEHGLHQRELELTRRDAELSASRDLTQHLRLDLERQEAKLRRRADNLEQLQHDLESRLLEHRARLEQVAGLDSGQARVLLLEDTRRLSAEELAEVRREIIGQGEAEIRDEARRLLLNTVQRLGTSAAHEHAATIVHLPGADMKGRLIGREGRNIKTFETLTGVTLLIDDTPDTVLVSCFDPVRREIARVALEALLKDGRIHPASIEDEVAKARDSVGAFVRSKGEEACRKLHLALPHPDILDLVGRLHFRQSFNQNVLEHSLEVAWLSSLLAAELGLDPVLAKRAGLFHDMGKAVSHENEGSHAHAAAELLARHGEDARVVNAVAAHHHEVPGTSVFAGLLVVADSLSATRPGARSEPMEAYVRRLASLEKLVLAQPGVKEAHVLQAGREVRVIVDPGVLTDEDSRRLCRKLRHQIEDTLQYAAAIKVTVIREQRFSDTAK